MNEQNKIKYYKYSYFCNYCEHTFEVIKKDYDWLVRADKRNVKHGVGVAIVCPKCKNGLRYKDYISTNKLRR